MVCELATHSLTIVLFLYVNIMFIIYMSVALLALPSRDADIVFDFPIPNPTQRHLLLLYVAILGNADPWT